jgi:tRNA-splicing ligase RtcB
MSDATIENIKKISEYIFEIPIDKNYGMKVKGLIYASDKMIKTIIEEGSLTQVKNAACLPGIVKASIAMPDIHFGYGLPIGGVVATDTENDGVISPGGVGFDINCGVRLIAFNILQNEIYDKIELLAERLFKEIPCGVGEGGNIQLDNKELKKVLTSGAHWAVEKGYGFSDNLQYIESEGVLNNANPENVSSRAFERGSNQAGTLGSGNHFLELGYIDSIFNSEVAKKWQLEKGMVTLLIHSGSRGLGHQVCTDYLKIFEGALKKYNIIVPDRQLACAPYNSMEAKNYLSALAAAANYAWANREVLGYLAIKVILNTIDIFIKDAKPRLIYDLAHNIVKIEKHNVNGHIMKLAVHRKGATRALPSNHKDLPEIYKETGQPVIIPGDMGRYSYLLTGSKAASDLSFNSACHGAGRLKSRHRAIIDSQSRNIANELKSKGIIVIGRGKKTLREEMPDAYKDVEDVVEIVDSLNIAKKVIKIKPLAVIKG